MMYVPPLQFFVARSTEPLFKGICHRWERAGLIYKWTARAGVLDAAKRVYTGENGYDSAAEAAEPFSAPGSRCHHLSASHSPLTVPLAMPLRRFAICHNANRNANPRVF